MKDRRENGLPLMLFEEVKKKRKKMGEPDGKRQKE